MAENEPAVPPLYGEHNVARGAVVLVVGGPELFNGCLMFVTDVKSWGVTTGMRVPSDPQHCSITYVRLTHAQYIVVGKMDEGEVLFQELISPLGVLTCT